MKQHKFSNASDAFDFEQQQRQYLARVRQFFEDIPLIPPQKMFDLLTHYHYHGQEAARKAITLLAYRHVRRLKRLYLEGISREHLPPKSNYLMVGPTGCGKTFMIELLFRKILQLPTVIADVTQLSETGYVGNDTCTILTTLLEHTGHDPIAASAGIICLDEFDKLATTQNQARFDGQGTTKDVSGYGVQRELLRIIEGTEMMVPVDMNNTLYSQRISLRTEDITFIACGTFSGFKGITRHQNPHIGFTVLADSASARPGQNIAVTFDDQEINDVENFQLYGFIPELMGRFTRIIALQPLDRETLKAILQDSVVKKFVREFQEEGIALQIDPAVLDHVVDQSFKRQTGARGLASVLTAYLEDAAFQAFCTDVRRVTLRLQGQEIVNDLA
ncbi:AAA domain-containing protein [candidate division KSB3 bacterium]|uniref:AAA domain-containing protein n=1 Tax=candidate division KSB3 bacterium TaxID=2044937 RepID=A0A9D5JSL5_9BACT|nr:AAA domain-containing protein [candidate division KSB3 bacterium]MBD3323465.1 AAA domain-containing protein [candidate division KSB3 bacterium]